MSEPLSIAILSSSVGAYSTRRLREAASMRGHRVRVLNPLRFSLFVRSGKAELCYRGEPLPAFVAALPRIGASVSRFGISVVRQLEAAGTLAVNSSLAIARARDKLWTMQLLSQRDLRLPATAFGRGREVVRRAVRELGGAPLVVKVVEGSQGVGVLLAETNSAAEAMVEALQLTGQRVMLQELVRESLGSDLRALVVGGQVLAAMRRRAASGDFRANVHRGARVERAKLEPAYEKAALCAAAALGLEVAGVDLLETQAGPVVLELNASPGLEAIERASAVDVSGAIVERLVELARGPRSPRSGPQLGFEEP